MRTILASIVILLAASDDTHAQNTVADEPTKPAIAANRETSVKKLITLAEVAQVSGGVKELLQLRMALDELDMAVQGKQSTEEEKSARQKARTLLANVKVPETVNSDAWKLYKAGFFTFGDVNAVAKGDTESITEHPLFQDKYLCCSRYETVSGLLLYKEDMDLIMAKAGGILVGAAMFTNRATFIGKVTLLDDGDLGRQAAVLRKAFSLKGGVGVRVEFHEAPKAVVIAKVSTVE